MQRKFLNVTEKFPEHMFFHHKVVCHQQNQWLKIQNYNLSTSV